MVQTKNQNENKQRSIIKQIWLGEFMVRVHALLNNEFYQCIKFRVVSFYSLEVMVRKKNQT